MEGVESRGGAHRPCSVSMHKEDSQWAGQNWEAETAEWEELPLSQDLTPGTASTANFKDKKAGLP